MGVFYSWPSPSVGTAVPEPQAIPHLFTVTEVAGFFKISKQRVYQLIKDGELGSVQIGHQRRIPLKAIQTYLGNGVKT